MMRLSVRRFPRGVRSRSLSNAMPRTLSAAEAVSIVQGGDTVFVHTAAMTPTPLLEALVAQRERLDKPVRLLHLHTEGPASYLQHPDRFNSVAFFCGANDRDAVNKGNADFVPIFLSEISQLWKTGRMPLDCSLLSVSPPDRHGMCSLGCSVDVSVSAMQHSRHVVALMSFKVPRTQGDGVVHVSRFDTIVEDNSYEPWQAEAETPSLEEKRVGEAVASLIPNGATLQLGIGSIPDATLHALSGHRHLGIHSEMFSDGVLKLLECGVIDGSCKTGEPFQIVGSFVKGSRRLYDAIDGNPGVKMMRSSYVNDPAVIKTHHAMHAINSCIQIDLTGQVCADSIGTRMYSGVGGQMDFMRGAALSPEGKPIMALTSRTGKGISRIAPVLNSGAGVTTTRPHIHYVVTEYGAVDLFGKTLRERAELLTSIAHPDDRAGLREATQKRFS